MPGDEKVPSVEDGADGALSDDDVAAIAGGLGYGAPGSFPGEAI